MYPGYTDDSGSSSGQSTPNPFFRSPPSYGHSVQLPKPNVLHRSRSDSAVMEQEQAGLLTQIMLAGFKEITEELREIRSDLSDRRNRRKSKQLRQSVGVYIVL